MRPWIVSPLIVLAIAWPACAAWKRPAHAVLSPAAIAACQALVIEKGLPQLAPVCATAIDRVLDELLSHERAAKAGNVARQSDAAID